MSRGNRGGYPGPTGDFPRGKAYDDDEGGIAIAVAHDLEKDLVRVDFGKSITWFALPKKQALKLGQMIISHASKLKGDS